MCVCAFCVFVLCARMCVVCTHVCCVMYLCVCIYLTVNNRAIRHSCASPSSKLFEFYSTPIKDR